MIKRIKRFIVILFFSLLLGIKNCYAVIDVAAYIQTFIELYKEIENKINEIEKYKSDFEKRAKQGFSAAQNCFKNPTQCDPEAFNALGIKAPGFVQDKIKDINVMPGSKLNEGDLSTKGGKEMMDDVLKSYVYLRGQGKDLKNLRKNRKNNNAVVTDDLATLFAKGMTTRNSIQAENGKLYQINFTKNNLDEILSAQNIVGIASESRLARILELRAYMIGAEATAELTQQNREEKEKEQQ